MASLGKLMKQAAKMQRQMHEAQAQMADKVVEASSGGGAVQDALSEAVFKFCGEEVNVNGAGRTDTGVHARGQVAHLDIEKSTDASTLLKALNFHLKPHPVAVLSAQLVDNEFDARFSALRRHYEYRILSRRVRPTLMVERVWWVPVELDVAAMQEASGRLTGRHDFTTFRSAHCQAASPERSLDRLDVVAEDGEIRVRAAARSFLHHQVRSMVGSLKLVGEGKWSADNLSAALEAKDRAACAPVAPAHGLYFMSVDYEK